MSFATNPIKFSLEEAMEYIRDDEYLEITPTSLHIRKIRSNSHFAGCDTV